MAMQEDRQGLGLSRTRKGPAAKGSKEMGRSKSIDFIVPYLALGPSAHSFQAGSRWRNIRSIKKYCQLLGVGKAPDEASEALSEEQLDLKALALGLRTSDGVVLHAPGGRLRWGKALEEWHKSHLVNVNNGRIQPTGKGFLEAESLPLIFHR